MNDKSESLKLHEKLQGKIEIVSRVKITTKQELAVAYTPGVADPCLEIAKDPLLSYVYTRRGNMVAVITDGSAVLGLGNIGPEAGMPVMEGKAVLFKTLANIDAVPLCLRTQDTEEIIRTISLLAGSFGGINLEDISAPRCFEIEKRLKEICDIPVFHDDQHGTAIVIGAALINALRVTGKTMTKIKVVINGAGAAGVAVANYLLGLGVQHMIVCDRFGIICDGDISLSETHKALAKKTNTIKITGFLKDAMLGADVFIGVSGPNCVTKEMIASMNEKSIVFAMANPIPEILPEDAIDAGVYIMGTGSSKYPNQINNVLAFPGIFRGTLDVRASDINLEMMLAASHAMANYIPSEQLSTENIIPHPLDLKVHQAIASAVSLAAIKSGVARKLK